MTVRMHITPDHAGKSRPAERFERKYFISPGTTGLAYGLLHQVCIKDSQYWSERINSLYFDTPDLEQHEKSSSGDLRKDKVRIRWYGTTPDPSGQQDIYIEVKSRNGFSGTKQRRRMQVPVDNLETGSLVKGIIPFSTLEKILAEFGYIIPEMLLPVIKISYWRYRFTEVLTGQRVSLDSHIRSTMVRPCCGNGERELELPGSVIEIKGQTMELPFTLMKARMLDTDWTRFSKYSASIDAHMEKPGAVGRLSPSGRIVD